MKKNIIIVTLAIVLVAVAGYHYNAARLNLNINTNLTKQLNVASSSIERLILSEKTAIDSADYYKLLVETTNYKLDSLTTKVTEYKKEIDNIPDLIANTTSNEAYDSLHNYIPATTGELEYGFDSIQVKSLYADELELIKLKPIVAILGETIVIQELKIGHLKNETKQLRTVVDSCNTRANTAIGMTKIAEQQIEIVETELKWWKRGSVTAVIIVVVLALL